MTDCALRCRAAAQPRPARRQTHRPRAAPEGAVSWCASAILSLPTAQRANQNPPFGYIFMPCLGRWLTCCQILQARLETTAARKNPIQPLAPFPGSGNSRRRFGYFAAVGKVPRPQAKFSPSRRSDPPSGETNLSSQQNPRHRTFILCTGGSYI